MGNNVSVLVMTYCDLSALYSYGISPVRIYDLQKTCQGVTLSSFMREWMVQNCRATFWRLFTERNKSL